MSKAITILRVTLKVISIIAVHWDAIVKELKDDQVMIKKIIDEIKKLKKFEN